MIGIIIISSSSSGSIVRKFLTCFETHRKISSKCHSRTECARMTGNGRWIYSSDRLSSRCRGG